MSYIAKAKTLIASSVLLTGAAHADFGGMDLADWADNANRASKGGYQASVGYQRASLNPFQSGSFGASAQQAVFQGHGGSTSTAVQSRERYPVGKPTLQCVVEAARRQNVPADLLLAVNSVERGNTGQFVGNTNGTQDMGAFQINTIHLPRARKYQATAQDLATRGCYNAEFAALLLHEAINHPKMQHKDYFTRAAGYHSWTPKHNAVYRKKLVNYLGQWQGWLKAKGMDDLVAAPAAR